MEGNDFVDVSSVLHDEPISLLTEDDLLGLGSSGDRLLIGGDLIIRNIESRVCHGCFPYIMTFLQGLKFVDIMNCLDRLIPSAVEE